jgi:hypothetical protein
VIERQAISKAALRDRIAAGYARMPVAHHGLIRLSIKPRRRITLVGISRNRLGRIQ